MIRKIINMTSSQVDTVHYETLDLAKEVNFYILNVKGCHYWAPLSDFQRFGQYFLFFLSSSNVDSKKSKAQWSQCDTHD